MRCLLSGTPSPVRTTVSDWGSRRSQKDAGKVNEMSSSIGSDSRRNLTRRGPTQGCSTLWEVLGFNICKKLESLLRDIISLRSQTDSSVKVSATGTPDYVPKWAGSCTRRKSRTGGGGEPQVPQDKLMGDPNPPTR